MVNLAHGYNGCRYGHHDQTGAMKKLETNPYGKLNHGKRRWVDLIVINVNKSGNLLNSKACTKCLLHLSNLHYLPFS